jgi:C-terminal processing protease CtpA/Prc
MKFFGSLRTLGTAKTLSSFALLGLMSFAQAESFSGIGAFLQPANDQKVVVHGVVNNGPAQKAGLQSGDTLISANGQSLVGISVESVTALVRGPSGSTVDLEVANTSGYKQVSVSRIPITVTPVTGSENQELSLQQIKSSAVVNGANAYGILGVYSHGVALKQGLVLNKDLNVVVISTEGSAPVLASNSQQTQVVDVQGRVDQSLTQVGSIQSLLKIK